MDEMDRSTDDQLKTTAVEATILFFWGRFRDASTPRKKSRSPLLGSYAAIDGVMLVSCEPRIKRKQRRNIEMMT
jgi:hypothetical protein